MSFDHTILRPTGHRLARRALFTFLMTFLSARTLVYLIMSRQISNLYLFLQDSHLHQVNFGTFLLAAVAAYILFFRPVGTAANVAALAYGFTLGLTFNEIGLWLNLDATYWPRVSVDAGIVIVAVIALLVYSRSIERFESRHFWSFLFLLLALSIFGFVLVVAGEQLASAAPSRLRELELLSSP